jgi:FtsP/CotA-like multicopper oxidase with cupredoxin domain
MSKHLIGRLAAVVAVVVLVAVVAVLGKMWWESRLPDTYNVMSYGTHDYGGGPVPSGHEGHAAHGTISVADLRGPGGRPDARFVLSARAADVRLASGRVVHALTFNGRSPGPELRVHEGDLVEVVLRNEDVENGVTIHWHGVDVPNAEDGVAGVTQDAVLPGERYVYRFRVHQTGTFWYHTHQASSKEVRRGLFGAFVVTPQDPSPDVLDVAVPAHVFDGIPTLGGADKLERRAVSPGTNVRLRLINTDNTPQRFNLSGSPFSVVAIDGTDLNEPPPVTNATLEIAGGGRYDIAFTMPETPVRLSLVGTKAGLALSSDGAARPPAQAPGPPLDPLTYGLPSQTQFDSTSRFDRRFDLTVGRRPGFYDGRPGLQWTINGGIYPDVPIFVIEQGDLVEVTIANHTKTVHPMHLHGHHMLVLTRNDVSSSGSPWWVDTLDVKPGERYDLAFRADNPGIWMDHCHNLRHAAAGLTMHVAYANVTTPYLVGAAHHNHPE